MHSRRSSWWPWTSPRTRSSWPARTRSRMRSRTGSPSRSPTCCHRTFCRSRSILANLPYVRRDAIAGLPRATGFEPVLALDGGVDGLEVIGRLVDRLPLALVEDGVALLEIGADQGEAIVSLAAERLPGWRCVVELDLAGLPRVARLERAAGS